MARFAPLAAAGSLAALAGFSWARPRLVRTPGWSRTLSSRYPLADLEEALAEGIMVGHQGLEMPQFQLAGAQIQALLAYLTSIQAK